MRTDIPYSLGDYVSILRRRWIYLATIWPAVILGCVYLAYSLQPSYRSTATILLESSSIPEDLIKTTVTAYADEQLELVTRRILTPDNLATIVEETNPYSQEPALDVRTKARRLAENIETERVDPITFDPVNESNAFSIHYQNPDAETAKAVADRLADLFLSYDRKTRTQQANETYDFLRAQSEEASQRILQLEQELADFKEEYGTALPDSGFRNIEAIERTQDELENLQQQVLLANERRRTLEVQLSQINPNLFDSDGDWRQELAALRAELQAAQQRYTASHPDVMRLKRAISALEARVGQSGNRSVAPDNPEYIQVANQLDTVRRELAALNGSIERGRANLERYERSLEIAPEVEREYRKLERDYAVALERFQNIEESLSEAALGRELESEARGGRLSLIRAPFTPRRPYSPNRLGIILLGIALGGGLAVGLAALLESSDPSIRSARDLYEIGEIKPIASVPFIPNAQDRRKQRLAFGAAAFVVTASVVFVGNAVIQATN